MKLNLIETLKTSIYSPKHNNNTKRHDPVYENKRRHLYFSKNKNSTEITFYLVPFLYGFCYNLYFFYILYILYMLMATKPN